MDLLHTIPSRSGAVLIILPILALLHRLMSPNAKSQSFLFMFPNPPKFRIRKSQSIPWSLLQVFSPQKMIHEIEIPMRDGTCIVIWSKMMKTGMRKAWEWIRMWNKIGNRNDLMHDLGKCLSGILQYSNQCIACYQLTANRLSIDSHPSTSLSLSLYLSDVNRLMY